MPHNLIDALVLEFDSLVHLKVPAQKRPGIYAAFANFVPGSSHAVVAVWTAPDAGSNILSIFIGISNLGCWGVEKGRID